VLTSWSRTVDYDLDRHCSATFVYVTLEGVRLLVIILPLRVTYGGDVHLKLLVSECYQIERQTLNMGYHSFAVK
jgi:hypothetical protein